MKTLLKYMKGYEKQCILGPLFKLLEAIFELLIPLVVASIVDKGIDAGDAAYALKMCLVMVLFGVIGLMLAVAAQYFSAAAAVGFCTRLRHAVMEHILNLSCSQQDRIGASTLITRMTSDINQVQNGVNLTLRLLLRSPFVVFGAMIMAFTVDFHGALVFAGIIPVLCIIVFSIMLITMPMQKQVQTGLDRVTAAARENLKGVRVLRAFCKEESQTEQFRDKTRHLAERQLAAGKISALMNPLTLVAVNIAVIILIRIGAMKVSAGILTQGLVIALYNYMSQILVELVKMANLIITLTKAFACGSRISDVLSIQSEQSNGSLSAKSIRGEVEFRDVTAQYQGAAAPSLENISFTAKAGETIGVIGGTGSGKTTLISLIPRLYDPVRGQVLIDGEPVAKYDMNSLRQSIGIVPQKAVLFRGTVRQNLLWGNARASDEDLWEALRIAQAADVVQEKEEQLDSRVEQGGTNFSGGQRQRLTIARALVRKPRILILDDSASALDYLTDSALRSAIGAMEDPPTTFIVSQRAASVRQADRILVLDDGKLTGMGTHAELLEHCAVYQEIYRSQFSGEVKNHAE